VCFVAPYYPIPPKVPPPMIGCFWILLALSGKSRSEASTGRSID
jgi:hypothetical protein